MVKPKAERKRNGAYAARLVSKEAFEKYRKQRKADFKALKAQGDPCSIPRV